MAQGSVPILNKSAYNRICVCLGVLTLGTVGCGDGDRRSSTSAVASVEGGGVSGGPLSGTMTIYAVDADTGQALPGANVFLGAGQDAKNVGQTNATGELDLSGLSPDAQTLSVSANGYAAASWGLVKSAIVTIPLESNATAPADAQVTVTLSGWGDLPPPADGSDRIARFAFSRPRGLDALEASLVTKDSGCTWQSGGACSVTLSIPADSSAVLVAVAEGSDAGTPDTLSDDTRVMTALGVNTTLALRSGESSAIALSLMDASALAPATLSAVGSTLNRFAEVVGVPGISLNGQILLYPSVGGHATSFLVPTGSGAFASAKLWAVASADEGSDNQWTRSYERGIDLPKSPDDTVTLSTGTFLDMPSISEQAASDYSLSSVGNLQRLEFATPSGARLNALLFPTQTTFEIPAGLLDGEPSSVSVEVFDLDLDPTAFNFADLSRLSTRIAYSGNATP